MDSKELSAWLRPFSPMTMFVKSLRMETAPGQPAASGEGKSDDPPVVDPFAEIDLDSLSDDLRAPIEKAKAAFVEQQTLTKAAEQRRAETEKFARDQQSRADRNEATLKKHNLADGVPAAPDPDDLTQTTVYKDMHKTLVADGIKPELASSYAKMFALSSRVQRKEIMAELSEQFGPLVGSVNDVQADRVLREVTAEDDTGVLAIAEVEKEVKDNVRLFVANGRAVDKATVKNLASMAFGNYARTQLAAGKPIEMKSTANINTPTRGRGNLPSFGGSHSGGAPMAPRQPGTGEPIPANAETAAAVASTVAHFKKAAAAAPGTPPKK